MSDTSPRTFHVKSYGCQMNVYDGERMGELLVREGYRAAADGESADLVVLNTCHIREKAAEKMYSDVGRLRRDDGTRPMVAVAGCVAQAEGGEILRRTRDVDLVIGPQAYHRLPGLLTEAASGKRPVDTDMPLESKFDLLPARKVTRASAFLTVQEGCDKFCTYCVVPYTRGAEVSRPGDAILAEARALAAAGVREITLLGQNVNAWRGLDADRRPMGFAALIRAVAAIDGIARVRYTTSHPNDTEDDLIAAHAEVPELMPFLHLPVQSGSDRILKAMNRSHDIAGYQALLARFRAARPDIALSGDFIVGFPGETEEDFQATLELVRSVEFAQAYSFKYSPRPGTPAATMPDQIAPDVMSDRLARLQALLNQQQAAFNARTLGKRTSVLLERKGKLEGQLLGKSPWLQSVHVIDPTLAIGDLIDVEITQAGPNSLAAVPLRQKAA